MVQLGRLQKQYDAIKKQNAEIVCVFREEKEVIEGLEKSYESTKADFLLVSDLGKKTTKSYSQRGFTTYVIDKGGVIRTVLSGTKFNRPSADPILQALSKIATPE